MLIVSQKSSAVLALDPDKQGAVLWKVQLGVGGRLAVWSGDLRPIAKLSTKRCRTSVWSHFPKVSKAIRKRAEDYSRSISPREKSMGRPPVLGTCHVDR